MAAGRSKNILLCLKLPGQTPGYVVVTGGQLNVPGVFVRLCMGWQLITLKNKSVVLNQTI